MLTPRSWYWDEPFFLGGSGGTTRAGVSIIRDAIGISYKSNWGSAHPSVALFLFGDGSVHPISYRTRWCLMLGLLTPDGGEAATLP